MKKYIHYRPSEEKKEHYKALGGWLRDHPQVTHKRLIPYGYIIDIASVPVELVDEFITITKFKESKL
jgi:hypothetical protein